MAGRKLRGAAADSTRGAGILPAAPRRSIGLLRALCVSTTALSGLGAAHANDLGIVIDGRTETTLSTSGSTTDIRTGTVQGANSYNSFSEFSVNSGRTVNIHIPDQAQNSINLVHGAQTRVDGTLNSVRGGQVGGNLYILNSNGVVVGPGGTVNTGSFNVQTPTKEFLNSVIGPDGRPNAERSRQITDAPDTIPLSQNGVIRVQGKVNAVRSVNLHGASAEISGTVNVGQSARDAIRASVNLQGLGVEAAGAEPARVNIRTSGDTRVTGRIDARGGEGRRGGDVTVRAGGSVTVAQGADIRAQGSGRGSDGGTVLIRGAEHAVFHSDAIIDVSGGTTGDGGFVDFSADKRVTLSGGRFMAGSNGGRAGSIMIDPAEIEVTTNQVQTGNLSLLATERVTFAQNVLVEITDGDLFVAAPEINVRSGVTLETKVGANATRGDVSLIAIAGNLADSAYNSDTAFGAAVGDYLTSGDIADLADLAHESFGVVTRTAAINVEGATILGNNVTLRAGAAAIARIVDPQADGQAALTGSKLDVGALAGLTQILGNSNPTGLNLIVAIAEASATVNVTGNSRIEADTKLVLDADAIATSKPAFDQSEAEHSTVVSIGGLYSGASGTASVNVGSGARLSVGQADPLAASALSLTADTKTTIDASATFVASGANPVAFGATFGFGTSNANVNLGGTLLSTAATDITLAARAEDSFGLSGKVTGEREKDETASGNQQGGNQQSGNQQATKAPGGGVAAILSFGGFDSTANALFTARGEETVTVNGNQATRPTDVTAKSLDISAASTIEKSSVSAVGELKLPQPDPNGGNGNGGGGQTPPADPDAEEKKNFMDAMLGKVADRINGATGALTKVLEGISLSGSIAIQDVDQAADARLASGVDLAGDLSVTAKAENERVSNKALVDGGLSDATFGVALALPVAIVNAAANAVIGAENGSAITVNAGGDAKVVSTVSYPGPDALIALLTDPFGRGANPPSSNPVTDRSDFLKTVHESRLFEFVSGQDSLSGTLANVSDELFNSISGAKTTVAGTTPGGANGGASNQANSIKIVLNNNIADFDTAARATVGEGVTLTAGTASVEATSEVEFLTLTGDASKGTAGAGQGSTSVGTAFSLVDIANGAHATVAEGASITTNAGDLMVNARSAERLVTLGVSADLQGGDVGISGAVGINFVKGTAEAVVDRNAVLSASGKVGVEARDQLEVVNLAGGITRGGHVGIGASTAFNQATSNVGAKVLDGGSVTGSAVDVKASNGGFAVAVALAGSTNGGSGQSSPQSPLSSQGQTTVGNLNGNLTGVQTQLLDKQESALGGFDADVADGGSSVAEDNEGGPSSDGEMADTTKRSGDNTTTDTPAPTPPNSPPAPHSGATGSRSNPLAKAISKAVGKFGINASADASVNLVASDVTALLSAGTVDAGTGAVTVDARSDFDTIGVSGAITVKQGGSGGQGGGQGSNTTVNGTLAGAFTHNGFTRNVVSAQVSDVGTLSAGSLSVNALNDQQIWGVAVSGSGTAASQGSSREIANIAGSVVFNTMKGGDTAAEILRSSVNTGAGGVSVTARDKALIVGLAGGAVYSGRDTGGTVGAAAAVNMMQTDTRARIEGGGVTTAAATAPATDQRNVTVEAEADRLVASAAMSVAVANGNQGALTAATSATYNSIGGTILSQVKNAAVTADAVSVAARDKSVIGTGAGDASVSLKPNNAVTAGLAVAVNNMVNSVEANVADATLSLRDDLAVTADLDRLAVAAAAGVSVTKGQVALKGSLALNLVGAVNSASGERGAFATVTGAGSAINGLGANRMTVRARDTTVVHGYAGAISASKGAAGIGAALVVNIVGSDVASRIDAGAVDGFGEVGVASEVDNEIFSVAASLGAAQNVALSGAVVVNVLDGSSLAKVGAPATIGGTTAVGSLGVSAGSSSQIVSAAGAGAISTSSGAGIGGAATVDVYSRSTQAAFEGTATLRDLSVLASAADRAYGGVAAFGVSGSGAGLAGAVGVVVGRNATTARVGGTVAADGNVVVDAKANSDIIRANIAVGGGNVGGSALASVAYLGARTTAEVAAGADVTARGNAAAVNVSGAVTGYDGLDLSAGRKADGADSSADADRVQGKIDATQTSVNASDPSTLDAGALFAETRGQSTRRGLAVSADSDARIINLGIAAGAGNTAGVGLGATATVSKLETTARIGANATVNSSLAGANANQDVLVRAGSSVLTVGAAGGVGGGGKVGIGGGAEISIGERATLAEIDAGASVKAQRNVGVLANSRDVSVSAAVGFAGGGVAAVGGGVAVGVSESTTTARIGNGATVVAGTGVEVDARSDATRFQIVGSGGIAGKVGAGVALGVMVDENTTHAVVGSGATITAGQLVSVTANSHAAYRTFTAALAGGGIAGVAGAVSVKVLASDTQAVVGDGATITVAGRRNGDNRSVTVAANSTFDLFSLTGGGGIGGKVGVGAGLDVMVGRATTVARIGNGATVTTGGDIRVEAKADKTVDSTAVALGGGIVGISGAINVMMFGQALSAEERARLSAGGDDPLANVAANIGTRLDQDVFDSSMNVHSGGKDAAAETQSRMAKADVGSDLTTAPTFGQTMAQIGADAVIRSGGDVTVEAGDVTKVDVRSGGLAAGAVGVGLGAAVSHVRNTTIAEIGNRSSLLLDGALSVRANDGIGGHNNVLTFTGAAGGFAGNIAIAIADTRAATEARIGNDVTVGRLTPTVGAYGARYTFTFTSAQKAELSRNGWTAEQIASEERRRTLSYHLVHEKLAGIAKDDVLPVGITRDEYDFYWLVREIGEDANGDKIYGAYDPSRSTALSQAELDIISDRINAIAATEGERVVATQEATITNAVKATDTPSLRGTDRGAGRYDVTGLYDPAGTDETLVRYWQARGVAQETIQVQDPAHPNDPSRTVPQVIWTAGVLPTGYTFTYSDRSTRVATATASHASGLNDKRDAFAQAFARYHDVHAALVAGKAAVGVDRYDAATATPEQADYWQLRNLNVSAGAVTVGAREENLVKAEAYGGSIGGAALGGQFAYASKGGALDAAIGAGASITAASVNLGAVQAGAAQAFAKGGNAGTFAAAGGVVAVAQNSTATRASVGNDARLRTVGDLTVQSAASPRVHAHALGVNVSGGYSVGVSAATTRLSNAVSTTIGNGARFTSGGNVTIGSASQNPAGIENAKAEAYSGSGGALIGASGALATNIVGTSSNVQIGTGTAFDVADRSGVGTRDVTILSQSDSSARIDAVGAGVGFIGIGAVKAENSLSNTASTTVGAGLAGSVSGTLKVASRSGESATIQSISGSGGVVAGAAAVVENTIGNTTSTTFSNGAGGTGIRAGRLEVQAVHDRAEASASSKSIRASVVGASGAWVDTNFNSHVGITLGSGFNAFADRGIDVLARNVVVKSQNDKTIEAGSGGLFDLSAARSITRLNNAVAVNVAGARLDVTGAGELNVTAANEVSVADTVSLDAGGAIAGAISESRVENRSGPDRAAINLTDASYLGTRAGSINMTTRTIGGIDVRASSKTYGGAGGAGAIANASYGVSNAINVGGGSQVRSALDTNIVAGDRSGTVRANTYAFAYNKTLIPIATIPDINPTDIRATNSVAVTGTGTLVGAARDVLIDTRGPTLQAKGYGEAEDWTKALEKIFENIKNFFTGDDPVPLKEIRHSGSSGTTHGVSIGSGALVQSGMGNNRAVRIQNQNGEYVDVSGNAGTADGIGFTVQKNVDVRAQLLREIEALNVLVQAETDVTRREALRGDMETLRFLIGETASGLVDVVTLDDVKVDTGDVNIFTGSLSGGGAIRARSDLSIDVQNESRANLRVNDLEVAATREGAVRLNGGRLSNGTHGGVSVDTGGSARTIAVGNKPLGGVGAGSDLYLDGNIVNRLGSVTVGSEGNIVIGGDVEGRTVEILAQNAIVQRFQPGFTHVGGLPYVPNSSGSMIAGGSVFLAGQYLNINGRVQGGIPVRDLTLGALHAQRVAEFDAVYAAFRQDRAGLDARLTANADNWGTEALQLGRDLLAGSLGGNVVRLTNFLDAGQPLVAAYNLDTREIEVQRTVVGGGRVTLFGHILSTGNGRINVTDGYGKLTVNNAVDRSLVLHGLDTGQGIEGKVTLVDSAFKGQWVGAPVAGGTHLAKVTEITRDAQGRTVTTVANRYEYTDANGRLAVGLTDPASRTVGANADRVGSYDPLANQTYAVTQLTAGGAPQSETVSVGGTNSTVTTGDAWLREALARIFGSGGSVGTTTTKSASERIGIGFIGEDIGTLSVASANDIVLAGDVANTTGQTSIVSQGGSILRRGNATISAADLTLSAANGRIGAVDANDPTGLFVRLTSGGILSSAVAGQGVSISETLGTLTFDQVDGGTGNVSLRAVESLVGVAGNEVAGQSITLEAAGGSIGTGTSGRVNIQTGSGAGRVLNAFAENGSVYLGQETGDLRVERIRAQKDTGVVDLDVRRGSILDANTLLEGSGLTAAQREAFLRQANVIDAEADAARAATLTALKEGALADYDRYWATRNLKAVTAADGTTTYTADAYDASYRFAFTGDAVQSMRASGVSQATIDEMAADRTARYHATHKLIGDTGGSTATYTATSRAAFETGYSLPAELVASIAESYKWTPEELGRSVNKALFSDRVDTNAFKEDPNIVAGSLRLATGAGFQADQDADPNDQAARDARAHVGSITGTRTFVLDPVGGITAADRADWLLRLAEAERDDITYVYDFDGQRRESVGDQLQGGRLIEVRIEQKEDLDVEVANAVDVTARGNIFLGSEEQDLNVHLAQSTRDDHTVRLKAAGSLTNARVDGNAAVVGTNVVLESAGGSVGSAAKRVTLDADILTGRARDSVHVEQVAAAGDLKVDFLRAGAVADLLVSNGALLDRRGDAMTNIRARTINLDALSIGAAGANRGLGIGQLDGRQARLNAVARNGSIHLEGTEDDLVLGAVEAQKAGGDVVVSIDVHAAALLKGQGTGTNILANGAGVTTVLKAAGGIGEASASIDVDADRIELANARAGGIFLAERNDVTVLNARNDASAQRIDIVARDGLTIGRDGTVRTADGDIRLAAASDGAGGDLVQRAGAGRIDAGTAAFHGRGEAILLENPVRAGSMRFETLRDGGQLALSDLSIGTAGSFTGGDIRIGTIAHTGGPSLLRLGFSDHSRPTERLTIGKAASRHGLLFEPFRVEEARINADTSYVLFPQAFVGRTMDLTTRETTVRVDQLSPAIQTAGVQIHQRPNRPFLFELSGREFWTTANLIRFDRADLTANILGATRDSQYTHTAFDISELTARNGTYAAFDLFRSQTFDRLGNAYLRAPLFSQGLAGSGSGALGSGEGVCSGSAMVALVALDGACAP